MNNERIAILMAVYNGEKYISQQIESIINQSCTNWQLLIRDDRSSDKTMDIINKFAVYDKRIKIIDNQGKRLGACLNFGELIKTTIKLGYEYIMFSDQDDVWKNDKIEKSLKIYKAEEAKKGKHTPILVHTDFQYVDEKLNPLKFNNARVFRRLSAHKNKIKIIVNYNYIFGCTMFLNRALLSICSPIPPEAENHDYWIALHAAVFGEILYIDEKTMFYRQHNNNVSGGVKYSSWKNRLSRILTFQKHIENMRSRLKQFQAFIDRKKDLLGNEQAELFIRYIEYSQKGGLSAVFFMIKNAYISRSVIHTLIYYFSLIIAKK
jgi:rhamnosyltransferase